MNYTQDEIKNINKSILTEWKDSLPKITTIHDDYDVVTFEICCNCYTDKMHYCGAPPPEKFLMCEKCGMADSIYLSDFEYFTTVYNDFPKMDSPPNLEMLKKLIINKKRRRV